MLLLFNCNNLIAKFFCGIQAKWKEDKNCEWRHALLSSASSILARQTEETPGNGVRCKIIVKVSCCNLSINENI